MCVGLYDKCMRVVSGEWLALLVLLMCGIRRGRGVCRVTICDHFNRENLILYFLCCVLMFCMGTEITIVCI